MQRDRVAYAPRSQARLMKRSDRIIKKLVSWAVAALYHRVEVRQEPGLTLSGPQLANASHFGGFTDPLLLIYTMDRVPRFVARDVIWKTPGAKQVMNWVGAIPVHKREDGEGSSNDTMFASTYAALHTGELITIFPEGITVDDPSIATIKTGSARIALGARAAGVSGIKLISAGIHYENKAALRSEVFIDIGWEMDLDSEVTERVEPGEAQDSSNRDLVRGLTDEMELRLRQAAPDFDDWKTARSLSSAANVALRGRGKHETDVGHGDRERLARLLDDAPERETAAVTEAMEIYQADLDAMGFTDEMFMSGLDTTSRFVGYAVRTLIVGLILVPFALMGLIVNAIPMSIVWLIGRAKVDDAVMATIKPLGALSVFLVTWAVWVWIAWGNGGPQGIAGSLLMLPVGLYALIAIFERGVLLAKAIRGFARTRSLSDVYDQIVAHRQGVVDAVARAA